VRLVVVLSQALTEADEGLPRRQTMTWWRSWGIPPGA
jgi:hypothetical protein